MSTHETLVCVHAHPDDESLFTAGILAHYHEVGYRTVVITCTNGQYGIDDHGRAGNEPAHDRVVTRATRALELQRACELLGVTRVVTLGFSDSGMRGWPQHDADEAFVNADLESCASVVAGVIDEEGASVVVTYDEHGYYGHPDHVMAHQVARRAVTKSSAARRLFYPVTPRRVLEEFLVKARAAQLSLPAWVQEAVLSVDDESVAVTMDVARWAALKQAAIAAHASQIDNDDLVRMDAALFALLFGTEYYQLGWQRDEVAFVGNDLFGGLS